MLLLLLLLMAVSAVLCNEPHVNGTWLPVQDWPLVPIHMVLTKDGTSILSYGNKNYPVRRPEIDDNFYYDVWDIESNTHQTFTTDHVGGTNLFCTGQATDPTTGQVLMVGGTVSINGTHNFGTAHLQFFDPDTELLERPNNDMVYPRWYPTVTTLGNSYMIVQGGTGEVFPKRAIITPEVYNPKNGKWRTLPGATNNLYLRRGAWWYPRTFSARGNVAIVFINSKNEIWKLDPRNDGSLVLVATVPGPNFSKTAPATMFDRNKILIIQGDQDASVVDISNPNQPVSQPTGSLREQRFWANSVGLPNGEVLLVGGASVIQKEEHAVKYAEIWNPVTGQWRVAATAEKSRLYHSAALLLPDATVLVGGGGRPGPVTNRNAEIYEPSYLFTPNGGRAIRPVITSLSTSEPRYGQTIQVDFQDATTIRRVSLHRLGSVTHSFDLDGRMLRPPFQQQNNVLNVKFSFGKSVAPPGWYMLFIVNDEGVPSVAKIVNLPV